MAVSVNDLAVLYADSIQSGVADVIGFRATKNKRWVFHSPPKSDLSSYPRIIVSPAAGSVARRWLNSSNELALLPVNIVIRVRKGQKKVIDGVEYDDVGLLAYVEKAVTDYLRSSSFSVLLSQYAMAGYLISENTSFSDHTISRVLTYQNEVVR